MAMDTQKLLKLIGGQAAIARECGIEDSAVSQWASNDFIPAARLQYLRLAHAGKHWREYDAYTATAEYIARIQTGKTPKAKVPATNALRTGTTRRQSSRRGKDVADDAGRRDVEGV